MIVLVTGAAGFIGRNLIPRLAATGHHVLAVDHSAGRVQPGPNVEPLTLDLSEPTLATKLPGSLDAIIHLAQANVADNVQNAPTLFRVNSWSTAQLLESAARTSVRRFVLASSGSVYGFGTRPWREDAPDRGTGFYAASKVAAERVVRAYGEAGACGTSIFRLFAPYGPGQRGRMVPGLINRVRLGQVVTLKGGRGPRYNPLYIDHVVDVLAQALHVEDSHVLNLGGDEALSIRDMAETIGRVLNREPALETVPGDLDGDMVGETSRLREHYRLPDRLTTFAEGVQAMVEEGAGSRAAMQ
jgi:nucleoside-diphosphate-sugar epimerase